MRRIAIVGNGGSGKSTLARQLGAVLGIEVFHLDAILWQPGWVMTPKDEEIAIQQTLVERAEWIIDGNYGGTQRIRMAAADTILFLDFPAALCTWRVVKRWLAYRGKSRPDMAPGCPEKVALSFWRWVFWTYSRTSRPRTLALLETYREGRRIVLLKSPRAVRAFVSSVQAG